MRTILIVGDSEAGAVQPYLGTVRLPSDTVNVVFKGGTRIEAWATGAQKSSLLQALAQYTPQIVVVMLGTNHYYDTTAPPIAPLVNLIRANAPGASILWVGPTSVNGKSWPVDAWLAQEAAALGVPYLDTEKLGIPLADTAHPTAAGAQQWLRYIWAALPVATGSPKSILPAVALFGLAAVGAWLLYKSK